MQKVRASNRAAGEAAWSLEPCAPLSSGSWGAERVKRAKAGWLGAQRLELVGGGEADLLLAPTVAFSWLPTLVGAMDPTMGAAPISGFQVTSEAAQVPD